MYTRHLPTHACNHHIPLSGVHRHPHRALHGPPDLRRHLFLLLPWSRSRCVPVCVPACLLACMRACMHACCLPGCLPSCPTSAPPTSNLEPESVPARLCACVPLACMCACVRACMGRAHGASHYIASHHITATTTNVIGFFSTGCGMGAFGGGESSVMSTSNCAQFNEFPSHTHMHTHKLHQSNVVAPMAHSRTLTYTCVHSKTPTTSHA